MRQVASVFKTVMVEVSPPRLNCSAAVALGHVLIDSASMAWLAWSAHVSLESLPLSLE